MNDLERWEIKREVFRKWLASLDYGQLNDAVEDVLTKIKHEADQIEKHQERNAFLKFMKEQFK